MTDDVSSEEFLEISPENAQNDEVNVVEENTRDTVNSVIEEAGNAISHIVGTNAKDIEDFVKTIQENTSNDGIHVMEKNVTEGPANTKKNQRAF